MFHATHALPRRLAVASFVALGLATLPLAVPPAGAAMSRPSAPLIISVTDAAPNTTSVHISWNAPARRGSSPIKAVVVEYSTTASFSRAISKRLGNVDLATLALPTKDAYYLRVAATNAQGVGTWSNKVKIAYGVISTDTGTGSYECSTGTLAAGTTHCVTTTTSAATATPQYSCVTGVVTATTCVATTTYAATGTPQYTQICAGGWNLDSSGSCFRYLTVSSPLVCTKNGGVLLAGASNVCEMFASSTSVISGYVYSCAAGDSLSGQICSHTTITAAVVGAPKYSCPQGAVLSTSTCTFTTTTPASFTPGATTKAYGYASVTANL